MTHASSKKRRISTWPPTWTMTFTGGSWRMDTRSTMVSQRLYSPGRTAVGRSWATAMNRARASSRLPARSYVQNSQSRSTASDRWTLPRTTTKRESGVRPVSSQTPGRFALRVAAPRRVSRPPGQFLSTRHAAKATSASASTSRRMRAVVDPTRPTTGPVTTRTAPSHLSRAPQR